MRYLLITVLLCVGCKSDNSKDAEIAKLKAQLASAKTVAAKPAPASPIGIPKPEAVAPVVHDVAKATPDNDQLGADAPGEMTGKWLDALLVQASRDRKIDYEHLKKNPDKYEGKAWMATAKILEVSDQKLPNSDITVEIGRFSLDWYGREALYFVAPFSTDYVEGNAVDVAGYLNGSESYTSQAGWNITIPSMAVRAMAKAGTFKRQLKHLQP